MKKTVLIIVFSLHFFSALVAQNSMDSDTGQLDGAVRTIVERYTAEGLPGMVVSVRSFEKDFDIVQGFSSLEERTAMTTNHQHMVASITKMFIGVVAMQLTEKALLDLDKPITLLPGGDAFANIPNASIITPRHLLNHTSGLPDFVKHPAFFINVLDNPSFHWQQKDLLRFLKKQEPEFEPGDKAVYCNSNFLLLACILDNLLGGDGQHVRAVNQSIISPLRLQNSVYTNRRMVPEGAANGYAELHNDGKIVNVSRFNTGGSGNGYSGLYSNAADLHTFLKALFLTRTLVADSTLNKMLSFVPDSEENGVFFGLGLWKEFQEYGAKNWGVGHRGRDIAHTTELWWFPEKQMSVVVLVNTGAVMESKTSRSYKLFRKELFEILLKEK